MKTWFKVWQVVIMVRVSLSLSVCVCVCVQDCLLMSTSAVTLPSMDWQLSVMGPYWYLKVSISVCCCKLSHPGALMDKCCLVLFLRVLKCVSWLGGKRIFCKYNTGKKYIFKHIMSIVLIYFVGVWSMNVGVVLCCAVMSLGILCKWLYVWFRWAVLVSGPCQSLSWPSTEYHRHSGCSLSHRHRLHTLQLPRKHLHHQGKMKSDSTHRWFWKEFLLF